MKHTSAIWQYFHAHLSGKLFILLTATVLTLASCSKKEYTEAIPANSTALIAIGAADFVSEHSPFGSLLLPFVDNEKKELKGVDLTKDIYIFAAGDGSFGLCAPLCDSYDFDNFMKSLERLGVMKNHTESDDIDFYICNEQWVVGHNDNTLLITGPVTGADAEARTIRRMTRQMNDNDTEDIRTTMLWQHLEERKSPIRMVAQANALPEQVIATVLLGAPQGTDAADVLLEADMKYNEGALILSGTTCSFNPNIKQTLKKSHGMYRPLTVDWERVMGDTTLVGIFMNVDGKEFTPHLQQNKALNAMLMSTNAYDRITGNNGDIAILLTPKTESQADGDIFSTRVLNLPPGKNHSNEKLVVAINLEAIKEHVPQMSVPFVGKIKKVIYNMEGE